MQSLPLGLVPFKGSCLAMEAHLGLLGPQHLKPWEDSNFHPEQPQKQDSATLARLDVLQKVLKPSKPIPSTFSGSGKPQKEHWSHFQNESVTLDLSDALDLKGVAHKGQIRSSDSRSLEGGWILSSITMNAGRHDCSRGLWKAFTRRGAKPVLGRPAGLFGSRWVVTLDRLVGE